MKTHTGAQDCKVTVLTLEEPLFDLLRGCPDDDACACFTSSPKKREACSANRFTVSIVCVNEICIAASSLNLFWVCDRSLQFSCWNLIQIQIAAVYSVPNQCV